MISDKHILVPIDFSDSSLHALDYAVMVANTLKYDILLIHVKRKNADYDSSISLKDFEEVLQSGAMDKFDQVLAQYRPLLHGDLDYRIRDGRIYTEICNQAKYGDSSLIIMGTHGVSGFEEKWVGSNAFRVASHATCPVFTVRYDFPLRPVKRIIMPIDTSEDTRIKVPYVARLAQAFQAEVLALDVRDNNKISTRKVLNEYMAQVMSYLKRKNIVCTRESLKGGNLSDTIIEYALISDGDLVAMMIEQHDKSRNFLAGAHAQQIVNHSPIPVFTIRKEHA